MVLGTVILQTLQCDKYIPAENVAEHKTSQEIDEMATLKDNTIAEMQFRSFVVSASHS